jgi:hypothetical protein
MEEIWKDIPDYEGLYQVSNLGRIKSLPKQWISGKGVLRKHNGKIMNTGIKPYGYRFAALSKQGNIKRFYVHQLVAICFLGHKPNGYKLVIDHINDNPSDNRVENLQIVTQRFNARKNQLSYAYSSQYKGVYWKKSRKKWVAQIQINAKRQHLGAFDCELKARQAYLNALKQYNLN